MGQIMNFEELYQKAHEAGMFAVSSVSVVPMIVGQETYMFSGKIDESKPTYYVSDGVCGFAWINVRPGNSAFARWLKENDHARKDDYYGGVTIWISEFNQSYQKKNAYAIAFAKVLRDNGIDKAYSNSRLD
jgi:hypothetical protein